jgi:type IV secretory pathway VirB9-like protein
LPETIDLAKTSLQQVHEDLRNKIHQSEPAVELRLVEKASVRLVRQKAMQRMQQYTRRRPGRCAAQPGHIMAATLQLCP